MNKCVLPDGHVEFTDKLCPSTEANRSAIAPPVRPQEPATTSSQPEMPMKQTVSSNGSAYAGLPAADRLKSCNPAIAIAAAEELVNDPANLKEPLDIPKSLSTEAPAYPR